MTHFPQTKKIAGKKYTLEGVSSSRQTLETKGDRLKKSGWAKSIHITSKHVGSSADPAYADTCGVVYALYTR